jgi:hypothetical protein
LPQTGSAENKKKIRKPNRATVDAINKINEHIKLSSRYDSSQNPSKYHNGSKLESIDSVNKISLNRAKFLNSLTKNLDLKTVNSHT